jgi:FKBP-type peptidyl-prolyl cis-trans isomerase FkpA
MKYIVLFLALTFAVSANAQSGLQHTQKGALYQIFTANSGEKIKLGLVITFNYIQKTDKDSVLFNSFIARQPAQAQVQPSQSVADLMEVFPLLALKDSAMVKVPTDSIFKGHEDQRPPFFPKGSYLTFILKVERIQTLDEAIAEIKTAEIAGAANYIAGHHLNVATTASGLKYVITKPSLKRKPLKGDTVLVNYAGRTLDDKLFDTSLEAIAKASGLNQPGRKYEPLQFVIGAGGIIAGWDEGMQLLNEGAKAVFVIPSKLAYGETGYNGIKPFTTLVFDIELVKIKPGKHAAAPATAKKTTTKSTAVKKHTVTKKK